MMYRRPTSLLTSTLSLQGVPKNGWSLFQTSSWNGPSHVSMLPRFYLRVYVLRPSDVFMLMYVFLKVFLGVTVKCSYPMSRKLRWPSIAVYGASNFHMSVYYWKECILCAISNWIQYKRVALSPPFQISIYVWKEFYCINS